MQDLVNRGISAKEVGYYLTQMRLTSKLKAEEVANRCGFKLENYLEWEWGLVRPYKLDGILVKFNSVIVDEIRRNRGVSNEY
jgi:hypothetical protein